MEKKNNIRVQHTHWSAELARGQRAQLRIMGLSGDDLESFKTHTVLSLSTKTLPIVSVLSNQSARVLPFSTATIMGCFRLKRPPETERSKGNTIFNEHLKEDTTHSSAPVLSFPQVRSWACPRGRGARWPTSAATPWCSRVLTCPPQTRLNSWGETAARGQTSAGLCGTGLHPESTHYSEWGLQGGNQTGQRQRMHNFKPAAGKLTVSVLIVDAQVQILQAPSFLIVLSSLQFRHERCFSRAILPYKTLTFYLDQSNYGLYCLFVSVENKSLSVYILLF